MSATNERGALTLTLPPGWRPLRGWILLIAAVATLNVVTYAGLTRPRWYDVTAQSRALEAARQARQLLEPALEEARANYGLVLQAENDLDGLHSRIASSASSLSGVIQSLQQKLQAVGMQFDRSTYAQERIDELDLQLLQMAVPFSGRYSAVRELVAALAAGEEFVAIDQVGLVNPDQAGSGGSLQVELQLAAFLPATGSQATAPASGEDDIEASEISAAETEPAGAAQAGESGGTDSSGDAGIPASADEVGQEPDESPVGAPESSAEAHIPERSTPSPARSRSDVSPVQRASELQARLASLPPLPFPPEAYDVRLSDLDVVREVSTAEGRNLFDYYRPPRAPAPPRPEPIARRQGGGGRGQAQDTGQEEPSASHPSIPLKLLGIVRVGAVRYASLTDGTELHVAAEGSSLPGGYEIVEVGIDYADIKLGETQVRLTLES
jgi:hypothetical protein